MLTGVYRSYKTKADLIDWHDPNQVFRDYIAHESEPIADNYFAGIVCRFWGYSGRMWLKANKHVTFEECLDCVIDAAMYVIKNRVWENPSSSIYNDEKGPDKAMHVAMKRQFGILLSRYNATKRLSNFNTLSLDGFRDEYGDSTDGLLLDSETSEEDSCFRLVSEMFTGDDYFNGLILDNICYETTLSVKDLSYSMSTYFKNRYDADELVFKRSLKKIKAMSNKLINIKRKQLLESLKMVYNG